MKGLRAVYKSAMASLLLNLPIKLLSLALSIALFSIVHSDQDAQRSVFIDVVALLPPVESEQMLLTELPHEVKVTLRGSRSRINALDRKDFHPFQLDLTDPGRGYYYFDPVSVDVGGNVQVVEIAPAAIALKWARRAERKVPVQARFDGQLPDDLTLGEAANVTPKAVVIHGPADLVEGIKVVYTDFISLTGLGAGTHGVRVPLAVLPQHVSYDGEASVQIELEVREKLIERTLRRLPVAALGQGEFRLRPAVVTVTLRGPSRRLAEISAEDIVPFVELPSDGPPGAVPLEVGVRGDLADLEVVKVAPQTVVARRQSQPRNRPAAARPAVAP